MAESLIPFRPAQAPQLESSWPTYIRTELASIQRSLDALNRAVRELQKVTGLTP